MCRNGVVELRKLQTWLCVLAHPQFTAVYAESQDGRHERHDSAGTLPVGNFAVERDIIASRVLRDGLCHEVVMHFVHHTMKFFSPLFFNHLVSGSSLCLQRDMSESTANDVVVLKEYVALALAACASFLRVRRLRVRS